MGLFPGNYLPQPVEIDPLSNTRVSGPYPPWEPSTYPSGSFGDPVSAFYSSVPINKTGQMSLDAGRRSCSQDALANWYSDNDGPWIPKGAVPEVAPDDRLPPRGYSLARRGSGYGSPSRIHPRIGNPSDSGSGQFGVPPSDSGYGTGISLDNSSVRSYDVVDHNLESRSLTSRGQDFHRNGSIRTLPEAEPWTSALPDASPYFCDTCKRPVKTKSELK